MENAVTVTDATSPVDAVKLHFGLQILNESIDGLAKSTLLTKATAAEGVIKDARDLIAQLVFTSHSLLNENERLRCRLQALENEIIRINNIGVIKNG